MKKYINLLIRMLENPKSLKYPEVINFSITNLCNYRCMMCNIWQKQYLEEESLVAEKTRMIFSRALFSNVKSIGISGGEPFLQRNLFENVVAIADSLNSLKKISFITNGSLPDKADLFIKKILPELKKRDISLNIGISLDGTESVHDELRGVEGAFKKAIETYKVVKENNIQAEFHSTISTFNIDDLYALYYFYKEHGYNYKFRIATKIHRLHNSNNDVLDFTEFQKKQIAIFFTKLSKDSKNKMSKLWYMNLSQQILGEERGFSCLWQNRGCSLDPSGNIFYCFPQSKIIFNVLEELDSKKYFKMKKYKNQIIIEHCSNCIHDYSGLPTLKFIRKNLINVKFKGLLKTKGYSLKKKKLQNTKKIYDFQKKKELSKHTQKSFLIVGWYGTETLGDKAILAEILLFIRNRVKNANIILASLNKTYSEITVKELEAFDSRLKVNSVINYNNKNELKSTLVKVDTVIMGGGPLMEIENVYDIEETFSNAKKMGKDAIVFGCGLGPFNKTGEIIKSTANILELSDTFVIRDNSFKKNYELFQSISESDIAIDPAAIYLNSIVKKHIPKDKEKIMLCIRDWPRNYCHYNDEKYTNIKKEFEKEIVKLDDYFCDSKYDLVYFPMHIFHVGSDDRDYFLKLKKEYDLKGNMITKNYTFKEAIFEFLDTDFLIGMRFHSVVFGTSLGISTVGIDYDTRRGKISGYLENLNLQENLFEIENFKARDIIDFYKHKNDDYSSEFQKSIGDKIKDCSEIYERKIIL